MIIKIADITTTVVKKDSILYSYMEQYIYGVPLLIEVGILHFEIGKFKIGKVYKLLTVDNELLSLTYNGTSDTPRFSDQHTTQLVFLPTSIYKLKNNLLVNGNVSLGIKIKDYINGGSNLYNVFLFEMRKRGLIFYVDESLILSKEHLKGHQHKKGYYLPQPTKIKKIVEPNKRINYCATSQDKKSSTINGVGLPLLLFGASVGDIEGLNHFIIPKLEIEYAEIVTVNIGSSIIFASIKYVIMEKIVATRGVNTKTLLVLGQRV